MAKKKRKFLGMCKGIGPWTKEDKLDIRDD
ncbi:Uncharacterised protein [uncultured archaeon]|nr:Uncharacterised protein [uncultured archaeon]